MARPNLIVALDVGSGKVTAVAAMQNPETNMLDVVAGKSIPCSGVRGGVVCDIRELSTAVYALVSSLERECERSIDQIFVAIRGSHLESFANKGSYHLGARDREITVNDMNLAVENAKSVPLKSNCEIVNVIEQDFAINGQWGSPNPEGMEGSLLDVRVLIVTGMSAHLKNLTKAIQRQGYQIEGNVYGLLALGDAVLTPDEKNNGAVLIDFGGETTSIGIYSGGVLKFSHDLPIGCDVITRDLCRMLGTTSKAAKDIKERYGVTHPSLLKKQDIQVPSMDGEKFHLENTSKVLDYIQPCVEELLEQVETAALESGYDLKNLPLVGVITGGGSAMAGMDLLTMNILGLKDVRRGRISRDLIHAPEEFLTPEYSTALALALYVNKTNNYENYYNTKTEGTGFGKIGKWIKSILGY